MPFTNVIHIPCTERNLNSFTYFIDDGCDWTEIGQLRIKWSYKESLKSKNTLIFFARNNVFKILLLVTVVSLTSGF
jgi:hypothetical protein